MPHIPKEEMQPRRMSSTTGISPEVAATAPRRETPSQNFRAPLVPKLSMNKFEPDSGELLESLFGKGADIDPQSGNLVLGNPGNNAAGS